MTFRLTKHHGLGNDFLVFLTDDASLVGADAPWAERARRWCARHHGVGADGLLVGLRGQPGADLVMRLYNADGSRAEMSGNGIRCLAHAEARRRGEGEGKLQIATDGGLRTVLFSADPAGDPTVLVASVDMGPAGPGPTPDREPTALPSDDPEVAVALAADPLARGTYDLGTPTSCSRCPTRPPSTSPPPAVATRPPSTPA